MSRRRCSFPDGCSGRHFEESHGKSQSQGKSYFICWGVALSTAQQLGFHRWFILQSTRWTTPDLDSQNSCSGIKPDLDVQGTFHVMLSSHQQAVMLCCSSHVYNIDHQGQTKLILAVIWNDDVVTRWRALKKVHCIGFKEGNDDGMQTSTTLSFFYLNIEKYIAIWHSKDN